MQIADKKIVIAIDGHSSCGKSTVAKEIAKRTGFLYIDSGAMYRVVTLFAIQQQLIADKWIDAEKLSGLLPGINISFKADQTGINQTYLDNENVEKIIRGINVSNFVSSISELKFVREQMVAMQQSMSLDKSVVMDGRDIGTVVFPNADLKIFMTAKPEIRAARRYKELLDKGIDLISFNEVLGNIEQRDKIDQNREISPLKKADDAIVLDNSNMNHEEQFDWIIQKIKELGIQI